MQLVTMETLHFKYHNLLKKLIYRPLFPVSKYFSNGSWRASMKTKMLIIRKDSYQCYHKTVIISRSFKYVLLITVEHESPPISHTLLLCIIHINILYNTIYNCSLFSYQCINIDIVIKWIYRFVCKNIYV